jgi:hypothetical protein
LHQFFSNEVFLLVEDLLGSLANHH